MRGIRVTPAHVARALVVLGFGLFAIAAQTLLFREFVTGLEGHDIAVGLFFAAWLLWVAVGAWVGKWMTSASRLALPRLDALACVACLAYIPALVLEFILILHVRRIAGVESYVLLPLVPLLLWSLVVCAPVSLVTGVLFPVLCRWLEQQTPWPITAVYVIESVGSLIGGLGATVVLALGGSSSLVFLVLVAILAAGSLGAALTTRRAASMGLATVLLVGSMAGLGLRVDRDLTLWIQKVKWSARLPVQGFGGSFVTGQAEYLVGSYQGQFLVFREGSVCEALPDREQAGRIAAIGLCQNTGAERVLVLGSGIGLCQALLKIPSLQVVDWSHPDAQYVRRIGDHLPEEQRIKDRRFAALAKDIRDHLRDHPSHYDIVIVNTHGAGSSGLNRYYTQEFYEQVKAALRPSGLIVVAVPGGENVVGAELAFLGASVQRTLAQVFPHSMLVPGDQTLFLAAEGPLSGDARMLRNRFAGLPGSAEVYPADALRSMVRPQRARQVQEIYDQVDQPTEALVNRDARPTTHLYGLLLASRQGGMSLTGPASKVAPLGVWLLVVPLATAVALRWIYLLKHRSRCAEQTPALASTFSAGFLIFSAGWVSISTVIVLMSLYQARFGTLYLVVGLVSALFMAGLTAGAAVCQVLMQRLKPRRVILATVVIHGVLLVAIATKAMPGLVSQVGLAAAFVATGLCCGAYLPLAAQLLAAGGLDTHRAASRLQVADHVGACTGGLVTGLVLVPLIGMEVTLVGLAVMVLANLPMELSRSVGTAPPRCGQAADLRLTQIGYVLFGIAASVMVCSNLAARPVRVRLDRVQALASTAEPWTTGADVTAEAVTLAGGGRLEYLEIHSQGQLKGYVFLSEGLVRVSGFGGPLAMALYVDPQGTLIDHRFVRCAETPRYISRLSSWLARLKGNRLWGDAPLEGVHAVTGATVTSRAVMEILRRSGQRFAQEVLRVQGTPSLTPAAAWDKRAIVVLAIVAAGFAVTLWGGFWSRLATLAATVCLAGFWLNTQYSTDQVFSLLSGQVPAVGLGAPFLLAVGVPLLLLLFGNVYCGYLCPFGALQELLGYILPSQRRPMVSRNGLQKARFIKYAVLFVLVVVFFLTRDKAAYGRDVLLSVFDWRSWGPWLVEVWKTRALVMLAVAGLLAVGVVLFTRFWCRYLCPAGAFLSLFNHVAVLGRFMPAKRFGCCEFGLTGADHLDCIHCDRCRYGPQVPIPKPLSEGSPPWVRVWSKALLVTAAVIAIWLVGGSLVRQSPRPSSRLEAPLSPAVQSTGAPGRDVDAGRIQALIDQGRLSDKEAMYYERVE